MELPPIPQTNDEIDRFIAELGSGNENPYLPATLLDVPTVRADVETVVALAKAQPDEAAASVFCNVSDAPGCSAQKFPLRLHLYDWMEGTLDFATLLGNREIPPCNLAHVARTGKWFDFKAGIVTPQALAGMLWNIRAPDNQFIGFEYCPPLRPGETATLTPWIIIPPGVRPEATMAHLALSPVPSGCYYLVPKTPTEVRAVRHGNDNDFSWYAGLQAGTGGVGEDDALPSWD